MFPKVPPKQSARNTTTDENQAVPEVYSDIPLSIYNTSRNSTPLSIGLLFLNYIIVTVHSISSAS